MSSSYQAQTTKQAISTEEGIRVLNNLSRIINREVLAGNPHAIAILAEAMRA